MGASWKHLIFVNMGLKKMKMFEILWKSYVAFFVFRFVVISAYLILTYILVKMRI